MLLVASALSSTPSDNLWNLICLATEALSDSTEFIGNNNNNNNDRLTAFDPGQPG